MMDVSGKGSLFLHGVGEKFKFILLLLASVILWAAPVSAETIGSETQAASLDYLKKWDGQFPAFDMKKMAYMPKGKRFWDDPNVRSMMSKTLPPKLVKEIASKFQHGAIKIRGEILYVHTCEDHFCGTNTARLYFDLENRNLQVCRTETHPKSKKDIDIVDYWIGRNKRRLEENACEKYKAFAVYDAYADSD